MSVDTRASGVAPQEALIRYFEPDLAQLRQIAQGKPLIYIDPVPKPGRAVRIQAEAFRWKDVTVEPSIAGYGIFAVPVGEWNPTKKGRKQVKLRVIHPGVVYLGRLDTNGKPLERTINPNRVNENYILAYENNMRVLRGDLLPPQRKR